MWPRWTWWTRSSDLAKRLGAAYTYNGEQTDVVQAIQGLGGADAAIVLAATPRACEQALASLRPNGTLVLVGLPADNIMHLPIFETVLKGLKVVGSLVGTRVDLVETFELHADGRTQIVRRAASSIRSTSPSPRSSRARSRPGSSSTSAEARSLRRGSGMDLQRPGPGRGRSGPGPVSRFLTKDGRGYNPQAEGLRP